MFNATNTITAHKLQTSQASNYRISSIDLLRGLVMIIMALDHTRDLLHKDAIISDPLNLDTTTPILFFTRWITHFCAPVFVFLSGTSAYLQSLRKTKKELSLFLIKRGMWLIVVEIVIMSFAFTFDVTYQTIFFQTIWSIGISMIFLGLAIWLPFYVILTIGLLIVLGHNALDFYEKGKTGLGLMYNLMHRPGFYPLWGRHMLIILYPFLSWTGLMFLGYCLGKVFTHYEERKRRQILMWLGFGIILFFVVLRATNIYGDAQHWSQQKNMLYTFFSFINTVKYPPSLLFMCMAIGPALLFLAFWGNAKNSFTNIIIVYGRVSFFYFVVHFFLIHLLAMIFFLMRGHTFTEGLHPVNSPFNFINAGEGYNLTIVYLLWLCVVIIMYPLCKWFSNYKMQHKHWWLSYL